MSIIPDTVTAASSLSDILALEPLGNNRFRGHSPQNGWKRVFGGQVIAQALTAAGATVDAARPVHSMHAYFILPGDPAAPIIYDVDLVRDGGSFTTRRAIARQGEEAIFVMSSSYHKHEEGYSHQLPMPAVPDPDSLPSEEEIKEKLGPLLPAPLNRSWSAGLPIELRACDLSRFQPGKEHKAAQNIWFRVKDRLPDDPALHRIALAYASDYSLLDTALIPHNRSVFDPQMLLASLDHALWFHHPFRADEWLLYAEESPWAGSGRGFCRGSIFSRDGLLVASAAQEGVIRQKL
jgi:acyl-CoA thioesterase-2